MMKPNWIRWTITLACAGIALVHTAWPGFKLDATYTIVLVVAVAPWLAPVVKSIELPGGFKIEVRDIKEAIDKVTTTAATPKMVAFANEARPAPASAEPSDSFASIREVASTDGNLALVAFRIELERRLVLLAQKYQIDTQRRGVGMILRELQKREAIPSSIASGLTELVALGNQAAHGAKVSDQAARWMLEVGPEVFRVLDDLIAGKGTP
jgi:hypothetical protein